QPVMVLEGLLQRVQPAVLRERLDRGDRLAVALHREHEARARTRAAHEHGARAADAVLAADVRASELELVAQEIHEREPRLDRPLVRPTVHGHFDRARVRHANLSRNGLKNLLATEHTEITENGLNAKWLNLGILCDVCG